MIRKGQRVRIKPEWQDGGEDEYQWFATEDEGYGRVTIMAVRPGRSIFALETVRTSMLEEVDPSRPPFILPPPEVLEAGL